MHLETDAPKSITKWADITYGTDFYIPLDANQKAIRGYLLVQLGVDLENLEQRLFEPCEYYDRKDKHFSPERVEKVFVSSIAGTCYKDYACETWLHTFTRIKRAKRYILDGAITRGKYFKMLKAPLSQASITLIKAKNGKYYIDTNGNHRVTLYKLLANTDHLMLKACQNQQFHPESFTLNNRDHLYWLYAIVREEL